MQKIFKEDILREMGKKSKKTTGAPTSSTAGQVLTDKKKGLILDTTCSGLNKTTWQGTYNLIEVEQPTITVVEATADSPRKSDNKLTRNKRNCQRN